MSFPPVGSMLWRVFVLMICADLGAFWRLSKIGSLRGGFLLLIDEGRLHCACGWMQTWGSLMGDF